ncbi:MAG TPA: carbohydrate ABC transporter permease [Firmicutes bacterium]|nr:carbohydrate ABC transporter permease [Bacillota bacterium]
MQRTLKILKSISLYALLVIYLSPFFFVLINSFKSRREIISNPFNFPDVWSLNNFINAFQRMNFASAFFNSLVITIFSVVIIAVLSSMTAYLFVRTDWRINKIMFFAMVAAMLIPFQAIMIPLVQIYGGLNLLNSRWSLIYMYLGFGSSFAVFLYHGFIKSIPLELEEAAMIDGCSRLQVFFKIVFPLLKSTTLTLIILNVLWIWNDFLLPSLVLISPVNRTLPLTTFYFHGTYTSDYGLLMAALMLTILPVIIFYALTQKHIIKGVMEGAIKA